MLAEGDYADRFGRSGGARGLSRHRRWERPCLRSARRCSTVNDLQAWYGESHILHGVDLRRARGRGGDAARPQRRRQDHDAEIDHGHRRAAHRLGAVRGPGTDRAAVRRASRAPASRSARRSAASSPASMSRRICCCRRSCAGRPRSRPHLRAVPEPARAAVEPGHQAVRRRAADAGDRRILRTGARLLLLDEPTEGLAPVIIQQIGRTIGALKEQGFTILLVEQNFRFAATVADRYYVMEHGRVVDQLSQRRTEDQYGQAARLPWSLIYEAEGSSPTEGGTSMKTAASLAFALAAVDRRLRRSAQNPTPSRSACSPTCRASMPTSPAPARSLPPRWRSQDFNPAAHGMKVELGQRRPPEQAGRRLQHRAPVVRRRQGRRDRRRAEFRRGARGQRGHARKEQGVPRLRRRPRPTSPGRSARPTPSTGPTTPGCSPTAPARRSSRPAATPGSSSPPTMPSATRSSATPRRWSWPTAARCVGERQRTAQHQDFSSFLLQAQASKAKIIGLANAGGDTINAIKQAAEFGIIKGGQNLAGLLVFITDIQRARPADGAGPDPDRDRSTGT